MKKILLLISALTTFFLFSSCNKNDDPTQETTSLTLYVINESKAPISNATVNLFSNEDDANAQKNVLERLTTNNDGVARFENLKENETYYFSVNYSKSTQVFFYKLSKGENPIDVPFITLGTLILRNTTSDSYKFTVTSGGKSTQYIVTGNSSRTISGSTPGYYSIDVLQMNGYYLYPTTNTYTGTLISNGTLTVTL